MSSVYSFLNCNLKPTEVADSHWLYEQKAEIIQKYPQSDGKWMQFHHISQLDMVWELAKAKYRAGRLEGIHSMKVSTMLGNPRASGLNSGVIIFYCGPSDDEAKMKQFGQKLLEEMPYKNSSGFMPYKSDAQTADGTRATGQKKNYLYRLQCPRI
jgi:hypothetical protein